MYICTLHANKALNKVYFDLLLYVQGLIVFLLKKSVKNTLVLLHKRLDDH